MSLTNSIDSLRCRLCRNNLLGEYKVYCRETDPFGVPGVPELYAYTSGYFFTKNKRHLSDVLEIVGNISSRTAHDYKLLAFDDNASAGDLVLIGSVFYRVAEIREITAGCRILELEEEHIEASS